MSIWVTILGGAAGLAIGGPIGGLVGALAGHAIDHYRDGHDEHLRQNVAFSVALVALSAKMAKSDGKVTFDEVLAFREKVDIADQDITHVGQLWDLARQTPAGYEGYARQLRQLFGPKAVVFEHLMALLFHIANADGQITDKEQEYLYHVAMELGYDDKAFRRFEMLYQHDDDNPYHILNVSPDANPTMIRQAWLKLVRQHHPDHLQAAGLPKEFIRSATEKVASINAAYERIKTLREE